MENKPTKQGGGKNVHAGHRKRLFNTAFESGLNHLSDIQVLEMVLCYIIPRGDVNPLAHRLLDRFNNFVSVLDASVEELQTVTGLGEESAKKLHMLTEVFLYYSTQKVAKHNVITNQGDFYDAIDEMLRWRDEERLLIFAVARGGRITAWRELAKGIEDMVSVDIKKLSLFLTSTRVKQAIIVHNHPGGSCMPSMKDEEACKKIENLCEVVGCTLSDSYIVAGDGLYSMKEKRKVRDFNLAGKMLKETIASLH